MHAEHVPDALRGVRQLAIATDETGAPLGFVGVQNEALEMLFIHSSLHPRPGDWTRAARLRRKRTESATPRRERAEPQAQGFYEHCGWHVIGRSETDEQDEPYPILHMELPPTPSRAG